MKIIGHLPLQCGILNINHTSNMLTHRKIINDLIVLLLNLLIHETHKLDVDTRIILNITFSINQRVSQTGINFLHYIPDIKFKLSNT